MPTKNKGKFTPANIFHSMIYWNVLEIDDVLNIDAVVCYFVGFVCLQRSCISSSWSSSPPTASHCVSTPTHTHSRALPGNQKVSLENLITTPYQGKMTPVGGPPHAESAPPTAHTTPTHTANATYIQSRVLLDFRVEVVHDQLLVCLVNLYSQTIPMFCKPVYQIQNM